MPRHSRRASCCFGATTFSAALAIGVGVSDAQQIIDNAIVTVPTDHASPWAIGTDLYVGNTSTGTLNILSNAIVNNGNAVLGNNAGSQGTVWVSGAGAQWQNAGGLIVGGSGAGTLTVQGGAVVSATGLGIGAQSGSSGTVTVTGTASQFNTSGAITSIFNAAFNVQNGAAVTSASGGVSWGGTITISGAGSHWTNLGAFDFSLGQVNISNGATVSDTTAVVGHFGGVTANVSGTGANWTNSGDLTLGDYFGTGRLWITGGASVTSTNGVLGRYGDQGSQGYATISGTGSTWAMNGDLTVGLGIGGTVSPGVGTMTITNGGVVSNVNATIASAPTSTGAVTISGSGSTWINSGNVVVGDAGQASLTITNGGAVNVGNGAGTITVAQQSGSSGAINIGAAFNLSAAASGTLNAGTIAFGLGSGALVLNHTDTSYTFSPTITGTGSINILSGSTRYGGDGSSFTGATSISGGSLSVNGSLSGTMSVGSGGTLKGNGTVGSTTALAGATIAPGNSIGTLTVGSLSTAPGSTYQVELNSSGQSDLIRATGAANLNGGSVVVPAGNLMGLQKTYTIVTALSGVTGRFDNLSAPSASPSPFLSPSLLYDANNVYLALTRNAMSFASTANTRNQAAGAYGLDSVRGGSLYNAVAGQNAASSRSSFDLVSGEIYGSFKTALIEDSHYVRDSANESLRAGFSQAPRSDGAFSVRTADDWKMGGPAYWGRSFGYSGATDSDGNAAALTYSTAGLIVGMDGIGYNDTSRLGFLTGFSNTSVATNQRGSGQSSNYHFGLYSGSDLDGLQLRSTFAVTLHDVKMSRSIQIEGFSDSLRANYMAQTVQSSTELAYNFTGRGATVEPFLNTVHIGFYAPGFSESGSVAALQVTDQTKNVFLGTMGLRSSVDLDGTIKNRLYGTVGWRHTFNDTIPTSQNNFNGGSQFTVSGVPLARDAAIVEVGLNTELADCLLFNVSYYGQMAQTAFENGIVARLSKHF